MSGQKIRLFIVDENPMVQQALAERLGREPDLEVVGRSEGETQTLLEQVRMLQPDVLVFECKRRDGCGLRLCQKVLELENNPEIIVLSSFINENERLAARSLGVRRYLLKDIATLELIYEIHAAYADRSKNTGRKRKRENGNGSYRH
ncbi:MAG: response regulator transcription factor [Anaerolineae bacterium]|nr:response regulator transcription factor [Anaerolineae bacterium]